jgi:hypothetical protein
MRNPVMAISTILFTAPLLWATASPAQTLPQLYQGRLDAVMFVTD